MTKELALDEDFGVVDENVDNVVGERVVNFVDGPLEAGADENVDTLEEKNVDNFVDGALGVVAVAGKGIV